MASAARYQHCQLHFSWKLPRLRGNTSDVNKGKRLQHVSVQSETLAVIEAGEENTGLPSPAAGQTLLDAGIRESGSRRLAAARPHHQKLSQQKATA